jgi:hypothetical protein
LSYLIQAAGDELVVEGYRLQYVLDKVRDFLQIYIHVRREGRIIYKMTRDDKKI